MEGNRSEIVFFDVETTIPSRKGQKFALLEFGAILVCPRKLLELQSYCTLIKPENILAISEATTNCNGITRQAVADAPKFEDVADRVYDILHGRVWAGHNILSFDCVRIRDAFAEIGRPGPEAKGIIDSLRLLQTKFGRRAGNLKMATLADYFGLGNQKHRSLDDVRMNLEVVKYCATVLFLEENFPDVLLAEVASTEVESELSVVSSSRRCGRGKVSSETLIDKKDKKLRKHTKKILPVNDVLKMFCNESNKETKEVLKDSLQESKEMSNTYDKKMKGISNESVKDVNSEVNKGTSVVTKIFGKLQMDCSQPKALQNGNVGVLSDPIAASMTEQSEIRESECFMERFEEENYPDVLIAKMTASAVESEISAVSASRSCGHRKAFSETLSDEKLRKPLKKKLPVSNGVENCSNVSNKETNDVLKASVKESKEVTNTYDKEIKGVSNESVKVINKGTFDVTKIFDSLRSIWSQPQALQDGDVGVLSDPSNPIGVPVTEESEIREYECFLEPHEVCSSVLRPTFVPTKWGTEKMILFHKDQPLQMASWKMKIRFGISRKYFVPTGKPKLSFVVEPSLETCEILQVCDNLARRSYSECNGNSEWRPLITTKQGQVNAIPAIRMHIASVGAGESATYCTELYQKISSGPAVKLAYTTVDIDELDNLFVSGRFVDAHYSFDIYDYLQSAGIRLVARRLTVDL